MILPDFVIPSKVNQVWNYTGIDSEEYCKNLQGFRHYPHSISYVYNDRGFRDQAWPTSHDNLAHSIWCVGDSFTVGIGSAREHTWSYVLQQATGTRTINIGMDGASNQWIARRTIDICQQVQPKTLVVHWSYVHRRELCMDLALPLFWKEWYHTVRGSSWPDCDWEHRNSLPEHILKEIQVVHGGWPRVPDEFRIRYYSKCTDEDDMANALDCMNQVNAHCGQTKVIHSFIPHFSPGAYKGYVESQLSGLIVPEVPYLDRARDGHHYDILTSQWLVDQIQQLL